MPFSRSSDDHVTNVLELSHPFRSSSSGCDGSAIDATAQDSSVFNHYIVKQAAGACITRHTMPKVHYWISRVDWNINIHLEDRIPSIYKKIKYKEFITSSTKFQHGNNGPNIMSTADDRTAVSLPQLEDATEYVIIYLMFKKTIKKLMLREYVLSIVRK